MRCRSALSRRRKTLPRWSSVGELWDDWLKDLLKKWCAHAVWTQDADSIHGPRTRVDDVIQSTQWSAMNYDHPNVILASSVNSDVCGPSVTGLSSLRRSVWKLAMHYCNDWTKPGADAVAIVTCGRARLGTHRSRERGELVTVSLSGEPEPISRSKPTKLRRGGHSPQ